MIPATLSANQNANEAWMQFEHSLERVLSNMDEDEYLIISSINTEHFVQFAAQGSVGMRIEAVSNTYLDEAQKISLLDFKVMRVLGWNSPTNLPERLDPEGHTPDGSPNFYLDLPPPVFYSAVASLAVTTLRKIFKIKQPQELQYDTLGETTDSTLYRSLGIVLKE